MVSSDDLRAPLLALHKAVLAAERTNVERVHGELSGAEYLQIVSDPVRYGWLKPLTELVLALDPHEDDEEIDVVAPRPRAAAPAEVGHAVRAALPVADAARAGARHGPLGAGEAALSSTRLRRLALGADDPLERRDAARVERDVRLVAQEGQRLLARPRRPVDPRRDERVVDVADREDPRREVELVAVEPARVAAAVEPLVMVEHEPADRLVEAAELVQELAAALGVLLDDVVLVVVERARLLQDRLRDRELADVVQEPADREAAQARGGEAELLADLDRERRDAARVLLRRGVLDARAAP